MRFIRNCLFIIIAIILAVVAIWLLLRFNIISGSLIDQARNIDF